MKKNFPTYRQLDAMDCGPTCLRMIAKHYGHTYSVQNLREKAFITREGVSMLGISDPAAGLITYTPEEFKRCWVSTKVDGQDTGTALLLELGPEFYGMEDEERDRKRNLGFFFRYINGFHTGADRIA